MAKRVNPFKPFLDKIPAPFKNKFFVTLILFVAWMIFFDSHNITTQYKLTQSLRGMKSEKNNYVELIKNVKMDRIDLEKNKEKYAREHYYMQKKDEDVFIIKKVK